MNAFIYLANGTIRANAIAGNDVDFASITRIEVLGFSRITVNELNYLEALFEEREQIDLGQSIIRKAIQLRQESKKHIGRCNSGGNGARILRRAVDREYRRLSPCRECAYQESIELAPSGG